MGTKKSKLERELERSLKLVAEIKQEDRQSNIRNFNSLGDRLRAKDRANRPDALAGNEAFEDEEHQDEEKPDDWWD